MARGEVLGVPVGTVVVQAHLLSEVVAGCSGAVVLRAAAILTQMVVAEVRSAVAARVRAVLLAVLVAVVQAIGVPTS